MKNNKTNIKTLILAVMFLLFSTILNAQTRDSLNTDDIKNYTSEISSDRIAQIKFALNKIFKSVDKNTQPDEKVLNRRLLMQWKKFYPEAILRVDSEKLVKDTILEAVNIAKKKASEKTPVLSKNGFLKLSQKTYRLRKIGDTVTLIWRMNKVRKNKITGVIKDMDDNGVIIDRQLVLIRDIDTKMRAEYDRKLTSKKRTQFIRKRKKENNVKRTSYANEILVGIHTKIIAENEKNGFIYFNSFWQTPSEVVSVLLQKKIKKIKNRIIAAKIKKEKARQAKIEAEFKAKEKLRLEKLAEAVALARKERVQKKDPVISAKEKQAKEDASVVAELKRLENQEKAENLKKKQANKKRKLIEEKRKKQAAQTSTKSSGSPLYIYFVLGLAFLGVVFIFFGKEEAREKFFASFGKKTSSKEKLVDIPEPVKKDIESEDDTTPSETQKENKLSLPGNTAATSSAPASGTTPKLGLKLPSSDGTNSGLKLPNPEDAPAPLSSNAPVSPGKKGKPSLIISSDLKVGPVKK